MVNGLNSHIGINMSPVHQNGKNTSRLDSYQFMLLYHRHNWFSL